MKRLKAILMAGAMVAAVVALARQRLASDEPVDTGGWKPVDPA
ncbi:hypothetical protein BH23ACT5_BH23ACT5_06940 [soil metagenome]